MNSQPEPDMDYEVDIPEGGKYIRIRVLSDVTIDMVERFSAAADELSESTGITRILSDERQGKSLTTVTDTYVFAHKERSGPGPSRRWRIAVLKAPDAPYDCVETVMSNAGFLLRVFTEEDEAIAWLLDGATS